MSHGTAARWRVLIDPPADAAWNMAVDESLLESYVDPADPAPGPTLRLYGWSPPALSLGRSQAFADVQDVEYLREHEIQLVRRPTGGGAVLHDRERTYSLTGRSDQAPFRGGVVETYGKIAEALVAALRQIGVSGAGARSPGSAGGRSRRTSPAACFARTSDHEIEVAGRKAVGSAQFRRGGAFLQHGSILLAAAPGRTARVLEPAPASGGPGATGLEDALGKRVDAEALDRAITGAFAAHFGAELVRGALSRAETERAVRLRAFKYLSAAWTFERRAEEVPST